MFHTVLYGSSDRKRHSYPTLHVVFAFVCASVAIAVGR